MPAQHGHHSLPSEVMVMTVVRITANPSSPKSRYYPDVLYLFKVVHIRLDNKITTIVRIALLWRIYQELAVVVCYTP